MSTANSQIPSVVLVLKIARTAEAQYPSIVVENPHNNTLSVTVPGSNLARGGMFRLEHEYTVDGASRSATSISDIKIGTFELEFQQQGTMLAVNSFIADPANYNQLEVRSVVIPGIRTMYSGAANISPPAAEGPKPVEEKIERKANVSSGRPSDSSRRPRVLLTCQESLRATLALFPAIATPPSQ